MSPINAKKVKRLSHLNVDLTMIANTKVTNAAVKFL